MENKYNARIIDGFLSITHNGWQWHAIEIRDPALEIPKLIQVLEKYLEEKNAPGEDDQGHRGSDRPKGVSRSQG